MNTNLLIGLILIIFGVGLSLLVWLVNYRLFSEPWTDFYHRDKVREVFFKRLSLFLFFTLPLAVLGILVLLEKI